MARIEVIDRKDGLAPGQARLFDWIVESRGELVRPFQVLLHAPEQAEHLARLGHWRLGRDIRREWMEHGSLVGGIFHATSLPQRRRSGGGLPALA